jgi:hypothetical protein
MAMAKPPEENRGRLPDTKGNGLNGSTAVSPARLDDTTLARGLDAEIHARQLLEQAARYVRAALQVPEDLETLRTIVATDLLELAMLRARVDELERRMGVGR